MLLLSVIFLCLYSAYAFGDAIEIKKEYRGEGKLKSGKHCKDGKINGFITIWHKNGQKHMKTHFKGNKKDAPSFAWYPDGKKRYEKSYKNGKENGIATV